MIYSIFFVWADVSGTILKGKYLLVDDCGSGPIACGDHGNSVEVHGTADLANKSKSYGSGVFAAGFDDYCSRT